MNIKKVITIIGIIITITVGFIYLNKNIGLSDETVQRVEEIVIEHCKDKHNLEVVIERVNPPIEDGQFGPEYGTIIGYIKGDKTKEIWGLINHEKDFEIAQLAVNDLSKGSYYMLDY
jgi:hypothetical protein